MPEREALDPAVAGVGRGRPGRAPRRPGPGGARRRRTAPGGGRGPAARGGSWSPRAPPRRAGTDRPARRYGMPAMVAVPPVGVTRPSSIRSVVVLPAPLGPRNPVTLPCSTSKLRLSTATTSPKRLVRPWICDGFHVRHCAPVTPPGHRRREGFAALPHDRDEPPPSLSHGGWPAAVHRLPSSHDELRTVKDLARRAHVMVRRHPATADAALALCLCHRGARLAGRRPRPDATFRPRLPSAGDGRRRARHARHLAPAGVAPPGSVLGGDRRGRRLPRRPDRGRGRRGRRHHPGRIPGDLQRRRPRPAAFPDAGARPLPRRHPGRGGP